jgi:hypothetical protein
MWQTCGYVHLRKYKPTHPYSHIDFYPAFTGSHTRECCAAVFTLYACNQVVLAKHEDKLQILVNEEKILKKSNIKISFQNKQIIY